MIKATGALGAPGLPLASAAKSSAPAAPSMATSSHAHNAADVPQTTYVFFNLQEAAFVEVTVARLIPADAQA
jgi:hypothetical protein